MLFDRLDKTSFTARTFNFHDKSIQEIFNSAESMVREKIRKYDSSH